MQSRVAWWPVLAALPVAAGASIVNAILDGPLAPVQALNIALCWSIYGFSIVAEIRGDSWPRSSRLKLILGTLLCVAITVLLLLLFRS
jgi:hypothetical protein